MGFFFFFSWAQISAIRNAGSSSQTAAMMLPVPASHMQQAGAFPWLRADADVVLLLWSMTDHRFLPEEPFPFPCLSPSPV